MSLLWKRIILAGDSGGTSWQLAYITRRIDRIQGKKKIHSSVKLAMEDFCQLDHRLTEDKYHSSCERCAKIVERYSSRPGLDQSELFLRLAFSFITGNSDMHLKNFSLIETSPGSQEYILSEAYDLLPVNVIMPEDKEEMALPLNGKKRNLRRNDFLHYADSAGITKEAVNKLLNKAVSLRETYIALCVDSFLPSDLKENLITLINERIDRLK